MNLHIRMEFDLDTDTRQTTNITPVILPDHERMQSGTCERPGCEKPTPKPTAKYCSRNCFTLHGTRTKRAQHRPVILFDPVKQIEAVASRDALLHADTAKIPVPSYRSFTFPQGGFS